MHRPIEMKKAGVSVSGGRAGRRSPDAMLSILVFLKIEQVLCTKELDEEHVGARDHCVEYGRLQSLADHRPVRRCGVRVRPVAHEVENTPSRPRDEPAKDREQQRHFDSGTLIPRRQIDKPGRMCRADRKSTRLNSSHANISYAV